MRILSVFLLLLIFQECVRSDKTMCMDKKKVANKDTSKIKSAPPKALILPSPNKVVKMKPIEECTTVNGVLIKQYIGKEVGELLNAIQWQYEEFGFWDEPPGILRGAGFYYCKHSNVYISVNVGRHHKYSYKTFETSSWDIELFKKEIIVDVECGTSTCSGKKKGDGSD
jgi:hypothetical protein